MPGTERMACPNCGHVNVMTAVIDGVRHYKCTACGEEYYTPDNCLTERGPGRGQKPEPKRD